MPKMENSKHTPGPWVAKGKQYEPGTGLTRGIYSPGNRYICFVGVSDTNDEETDANTRLIAAAPDLLKALKDCLDFPQEDLELWATGGGVITITLTPYHIEQAVAAIAKAETV